MKLIIEYSHGDDECYENYTIPIEYESEEALICDFMNAVKQSYIKWTKCAPMDLFYWDCDFEFCGEEFPTAAFCYEDHSYKEAPPRISTLEDWFNRKKIEKI